MGLTELEIAYIIGAAGWLMVVYFIRQANSYRRKLFDIEMQDIRNQTEAFRAETARLNAY